MSFGTTVSKAARRGLSDLPAPLPYRAPASAPTRSSSSSREWTSSFW